MEPLPTGVRGALNSTKYGRLHSDEKMADNSLPDNDPRQKNGYRQLSRSTVFLGLHLIVALIWISAASVIYAQSLGEGSVRDHQLRKLEFAPVGEAIEYQDVEFDMSGFGSRNHPTTPYEGPPTDENNLRWHELLEVGIIALDDEMLQYVDGPTEPSSETDDTPLIQLDVFHQLHCLNSIRRIVYGTSTFTKGKGAESHIDHCIDYLRQTIMCHSDVTALTHIPRPHQRVGASTWMANFATKHTCRDFWKIHEWASKYNTSGWVLEGYPNQGKDFNQ